MSNSFQNLPHARALAFLGDAVFEIFLREMAVQQNLSQSKDLHGYTTARAKATAQVALLHQLKSTLSEDELEIIRQGRNVGVGSNRRAEQAAHRQATGFEALLGALYLTNSERLQQLLQQIRPLIIDSIPESSEESNL